MELKEKKVVVIGFGKSGQAATRLLLKQGAEVIVSESKSRESLNENLLKSFESQGVYFETETHKPKTLLSADLIVVSPGVPKEVYEIALKKDIPVIGELELAWQFLSCKDETIAITGTNGKTTTTAMVSDLLKFSGYRVFTGGNYSIPLSELVISEIKVDKVVLEVSSFQLETIKTFAPKTGIIINITPDHLERYVSEEEYAYYKYCVFKNQKFKDFSILPFGEKWLEKFGYLIKGQKKFFDEKENAEASAFLRDERGFILKLEEEEEYSFTGFKLLGRHNKLNFMIASLGARLMGATQESIKRLVKEFTGFPHRLEYIGCFGGVYFINDSKATNVDATLQALKGLQAPLILIMGGRHKGASYASLISYIKEKVKKLILMGESRYIIGEELGLITDTFITETLPQAVTLALKLAEPGDTILFSPACSSFDQFKNYEERGEVFRELVFKYAPLFLKDTSKEVYH